MSFTRKNVGSSVESGEIADLAVTASKLGYAADALGVVQRGSTDAQSGGNLLAAYAAAKSLVPGGNALSATNRACVLIPPGRYDLPTQAGAAALELDADYVDLLAMHPAGPAATWITSDAGAGTGPTLQQTAGDLRLTGFTLHCPGSSDGSHALLISADDNSASRYRQMHFRHDSPATGMDNATPVYGDSDIAGTWEFCEADDYGWRLAANKALSATMRWCHAGADSFTSDENDAVVSGTLIHCTGGDRCFGGCTYYGCNVTGTLIDCVAGDRSFVVGRTFSGTAKRCVGGADCFAGYAGSLGYYGTFSGHAEDCVASGNSFGMGHGNCVLSGTLLRCRNNTVSAYKAGTGGGGAAAFSGVCVACHPWAPTACTGDTTVHPFDSGQTYTNEGASGVVTWSLPAAKKPMRYTFCRTDFDAGEDVRIDPNGTEHIYQTDGTDCGAGKYYGSDPDTDAYAEVTLECRKDGEWRVVNELGAWSAEAA